MDIMCSYSPLIKRKNCLLLFVLLIVSSQGQNTGTKVFLPCFTQSTTTQARIMQIGDFSIAIFNPSTLMIGILKYSNFFTTTFITLSGNISNYLHGNFIYNRYGAQGLGNRQAFTMVGDQFYDGYMLPYTISPKMWKIIGSEYVIKLMPDDSLWLSHWKNLKYLKIYNISGFNPNSTLIDIQASTKEKIFALYSNGIIMRLSYNDYTDNFTSEFSNVPSFVNLTQNYFVSSDNCWLFHYQRVNLSMTQILKFRIGKSNLNFQLVDNFTVSSNEDIIKVSYSENQLSFLIQFSNDSFRVCGFHWSSCFHLTGVPDYSITASIETLDYLVRQFQFKNLTHFGVITLNNKFSLYQTQQFKVSTFLETKEWPEGTVSSEPLFEVQNVIKQDLPSLQYPRLDINENQQSFQNLSSSTVAIVYLVSLPQARKVFMFLNPLYMLLENFWFYNYQQKTFRPVVNRTFSIMRIINQVKLFPLPFYSIQNFLRRNVNFDNSTNSDFTSISPKKFVEIEDSDVSFLKNVQDAIIWGSFYTLSTFLFLKALSKFSFIKKSKVVKQFVTSKSHQGVLISALIQNNIQFYAFMAFSQLKIPGQLEMGDKVKMGVTVLVLFIVSLFSISGFIILRASFRKCWSVFIEDRTFSRGSMYFSAIWLTLQTLITGFANGFFKENIFYLQGLLISIDASSILCILYFWSTAKSYVSNILLLLYLVFKLLFDIVIYGDEVNEWVQSFLIAAIILTILYSVFWNISIIYKDSVQFFKNPNAQETQKSIKRRFAMIQAKASKEIHFKGDKNIQTMTIRNEKTKSIVSYLLKRYGAMERGVKYLNKIANLNNNVENGFTVSSKRVSLRFRQAQNVKSLRKKLESHCVSGKISSNGEILLENMKKGEVQMQSRIDNTQ